MSIPKGWDWNRKVPMWDWHTLQIHGYPGWELETHSDGEHPAFFHLSCVVGDGPQSRELAVEFDDIAQGQFYYRDWTDDGIPFVRDKETYQARFWFQKSSDRERFAKLVESKHFAIA